MDKPASEIWFEDYLRDRDIEGWDDHEPDLGVRTRADYRIRRDSPSVICEVKEFTTSGLQKRMNSLAAVAAPGRPQSFVASDEEIYGAVRKRIAVAATKKLRPLKDRGEALAVVLANPHGIAIDLDDPADVIAAMYGNEAYRIGVNLPPGVAGEGEFFFDRDGALASRHRYLSAVITVHRRRRSADELDKWADRNRHRWEEIDDSAEQVHAYLDARDEAWETAAQTPGEYSFVRVYSTISTATGQAVPVPEALFNGPKDQFWVVDEVPAGWNLRLAHGEL